MAKQIRLGGLKYDLELGVAKFTEATRNASTSLRAMQKNFEDVGKNIKNVFTGITTAYAVKQIFNLSAAISDLAAKGEVAGSIQDGFRALGGSATEIDKAKKAVLGTVDSFDLMATASKGLAARVPEFNNNFARIAELGGRVADTLGTDTKVEIENLTSAIVKGSAKGLAPYGFQLDGLKTKGERWAAVMKQLPDVMNRYSELADSAANAQAAYNIALEEGWKQAGIAINSNEELTQSYRDMQKAVEDADWTELGENLAKIKSIFTDLGGIAIPLAAAALRQFNNDALRVSLILQELYKGGTGNLFDAVDKRFANITEGRKLEDATAKVQEFRKAVVETSQAFVKGTNPTESQIKQLMIQAAAVGDAVKKAGSGFNTDSLGNAAKMLHELTKHVVKDPNGLVGGFDAAGKKVDELKEKLSDLKSKSQMDSIKNGLEKAIDNLDKASFDSLLEQFKTTTGDGIRAGFSELTSKHDLLELEEIISKQTTAAAAEMQEKFTKAQVEAAKKAAEEQKKLYEDGIEFWRSTFENAITGVTFDLEDALKQVAVGFAAELAQAAFGNIFAGIKSPQDLGGALGQAILGKATDSALGGLGLGGWFGGAGGAPAGVAGPPMENGAFVSNTGMSSMLSAIVPAAAAAAGAYLAGQEAKNIYEGKTDNSPTGLAGRAQLAFTTMGGSELARLGIGGDSNDPDTLARKAFEGKLEELIHAVGSLKFQDSAGNAMEVSNVLRGATDFNDPNWASNLTGKYGTKAVSGFSGVGDALAQKMGIEGLPEGHAGAMLLETFQGDIEGLKALIDEVGLSYTEFTDLMVEQTKKTNGSWLETVSEIRDANAAFQEGIEGQAKFSQAAENFFKTQGRGAGALRQLANIAVEGAEGKIQTIDQLMNALMAEGKLSQMEIDALWHGMRQNGIKTIEELKNASELLKGQVTASVDAYLQDHGGQWREMSEQIDEMSKKFEALNGKEIEVTFNLTSNMDEGTAALLESGALDGEEPEVPETAEATARKLRAGRGMMGDRTPEMLSARRGRIRPPRSESGISDGRREGITIIVNAEGAEAGVEARILDALSQVQNNAIQGAVDALIGAGI